MICAVSSQRRFSGAERFQPANILFCYERHSNPTNGRYEKMKWHAGRRRWSRHLKDWAEHSESPDSPRAEVLSLLISCTEGETHAESYGSAKSVASGTSEDA